eukprot:7748005-Alexandrium_andersonii.AAC.1
MRWATCSQHHAWVRSCTGSEAISRSMSANAPSWSLPPSVAKLQMVMWKYRVMSSSARRASLWCRLAKSPHVTTLNDGRAR